jgi:hypothetical protein
VTAAPGEGRRSRSSPSRERSDLRLVVGCDPEESKEVDARLDAASKWLHYALVGRVPPRLAAAGALLLIRAARRHLRRVTR